jgi:hypothetical protein
MKKTKHRSSRQKRVFQLVRRGHKIKHQIFQLSSQLAPIEAMLRVEALKRPFEHSTPEFNADGPHEWTAGAVGAECTIVFPGPQLQETYPENHPELPTIRRICGDRFGQLFTESRQVRVTDLGTFHKQVAHLFTPAQAMRLLQLCSAESESVVAWSDARRNVRSGGAIGRKKLP